LGATASSLEAQQRVALLRAIELFSHLHSHHGHLEVWLNLLDQLKGFLRTWIIQNNFYRISVVRVDHLHELNIRSYQLLNGKGVTGQVGSYISGEYG
jgi:hypothetical protein